MTELACLTPADVAAALQCGRREACALIRELGGWRWKDSWRIRKVTFETWLKQREMGSIGAARSGGFGPTQSHESQSLRASEISKLLGPGGLSVSERRQIRRQQREQAKHSSRRAID